MPYTSKGIWNVIKKFTKWTFGKFKLAATISYLCATVYHLQLFH